MKIEEIEVYFNFSSWDEIKQKIVAKSVKSQAVTTEMLLSAIDEIASVSHPTFFTNPNKTYVYDRLGQIDFYGQSEYEYSFVGDIYDLAEMIRKVKAIPNIYKLFNRGVFTERGMFNQFLVTVWLSDKLNIIDIELDNPPTDILVNILNKNVHIQVKDISQTNVYRRVSDAIVSIDFSLRSKYPSENDTVLCVTKFKGIPPQKISYEYWETWALGLEGYPIYDCIHEFENERGEKDQVIVSIESLPKNGTRRSPLNDFNNAYRFEEAYDNYLPKIESAKDDVHLLCVITNDEYDWQQLKESINAERLGVMVIDITSDDVDKSPVLLPAAHSEIEDALNKALPDVSDIL